MMKIDSNYEMTRRMVKMTDGTTKPVQGVTARSLIRMLKEADQEAVVAFAVMLPTGRTLWAGVHGAITDYDGTGACFVLIDMNVSNAIQRG